MRRFFALACGLSLASCSSTATNTAAGGGGSGGSAGVASGGTAGGTASGGAAGSTTGGSAGSSLGGAGGTTAMDGGAADSSAVGGGSGQCTTVDDCAMPCINKLKDVAGAVQTCVSNSSCLCALECRISVACKGNGNCPQDAAADQAFYDLCVAQLPECSFVSSCK